jgi:hypothetical protein
MLVPAALRRDSRIWLAPIQAGAIPAEASAERTRAVRCGRPSSSIDEASRIDDLDLHSTSNGAQHANTNTPIQDLVLQ